MYKTKQFILCSEHNKRPLNRTNLINLLFNSANYYFGIIIAAANYIFLRTFFLTSRIILHELYGYPWVAFFLILYFTKFLNNWATLKELSVSVWNSLGSCLM